MKGVVEGIFVTAEGSAAMERVDEVQTVEGCGIEGDRYCEGTGFWTRYGDVCQVTLIEGEDLDYIQNELGIGVKDGQHRRNIVTRGIRLRDLRKKTFRIGETAPQLRPPASALQARAGHERAGHDARPQEQGRHLRQGRQSRQHQGGRHHRNGIRM